MTDRQPEVGASPTFELGPAETVDGKTHQLVFTSDGRFDNPVEQRAVAMQNAVSVVNSNPPFFADKNVTAEHLADYVLDVAEQFMLYISGGAR